MGCFLVCFRFGVALVWVVPLKTLGVRTFRPGIGILPVFLCDVALVVCSDPSLAPSDRFIGPSAIPKTLAQFDLPINRSPGGGDPTGRLLCAEPKRIFCPYGAGEHPG
jgi:hypothetical protein